MLKLFKPLAEPQPAAVEDDELVVFDDLVNWRCGEDFKTEVEVIVGLRYDPGKGLYYLFSKIGMGREFNTREYREFWMADHIGRRTAQHYGAAVVSALARGETPPGRPTVAW